MRELVPAQLGIRILGTFELVVAGDVVKLAARPRALLAVLVLRAGQVVPAESLSSALWGGSAPASAASILRVYVAQLRAVLPPGRLLTERAGYRLELGSGELDAEVFERLLGDANRALASGNARLAHSLQTRALELWRGEALADLNGQPFARDEAARLDELRLACLEGSLETSLRLGRHAEVVADLERLTNEHPTREHLRALHMLALYRVGRQTEALASYREARTELVESLGLEPGEELRELERQILRQDPALAAPGVPDVARAQVPPPRTRTIGRDQELGRLRELIERSSVRLVTLVGPGGIGKTRLATELALAVGPDLADGAVLVDLAPLTDPAQLLPTIGRALGLREQAAAGWDEVLAADLRGRELLLVLDNFEQLVEGAAVLAPLLDVAPAVTMLATSRRVLRLSAEYVIDVQPLDETAARELLSSRTVASGVVVDVDAPAIAEIAARLEGMPLAIELAAPWFRTLSANELLERLRAGLDVLEDGPQDAPDRHRAMRAAIQWSVGLLTPPAQHLLGRVSLFRDSFTAVAALEVGGPGAHAAQLEELVEASILQAGDAEYRLLEVVRQFGEELPSADDEGRALHASSFLALAKLASAELAGADQAHWLERLKTSHDDLRAALDWLEVSGEAALGLSLANALGRFWYIRGHLSEGLDRLARAVAAAPAAEREPRANALRSASALAILQGDYPEARRLVEGALALYRSLGNDLGVVRSLNNLGAVLHAQDELEAAAATLDECITIAESLGESRLIALARNNRGDVALSQSDLVIAASQFEQSLALLRAAGDVANVARSLYNLGAVAVVQEELPRATELLLESLDLSLELDDKEDVAWCLFALAAVSTRLQKPHEAAVVLGFGQAFLERIGATLKPFEERLFAGTLADLGAVLEPSELETSLTAGARMPDSEAFALARAAVA